MKTGIWGSRQIAHTHAEALKANGIKIGAIVDVSEEKAKAFAEEFSIEKWELILRFFWTMRLQPSMYVHRLISIMIW